MNYRHLYHAGNFCDVIKHVVLVQLIQATQRKDKHFCYIDTHAGIGCYELNSEQVKKTLEYSRGILPVLKADDSPEELQPYLTIVKEFNREASQASPQFYPGSPCIAQRLLRAQDRMILNELHPEDYQSLRHRFYPQPTAAVHNRDAYEFLLAMLPPREKRGVILIDPAYEKTDELAKASAALANAFKRFPSGVYAFWMPIKDRSYRKFYRALAACIDADILLVELTMAEVPHQADGLMGTAMLLINPPFQIEKSLAAALKWLWKLWSAGKGGWKVEKLTNLTR